MSLRGFIDQSSRIDGPTRDVPIVFHDVFAEVVADFSSGRVWISGRYDDRARREGYLLAAPCFGNFSSGFRLAEGRPLIVKDTIFVVGVAEA